MDRIIGTAVAKCNSIFLKNIINVLQRRVKSYSSPILFLLSLPLYLIYHRHKPTSSRYKEIECNEISIRLGLVYACVYACVRGACCAANALKLENCCLTTACHIYSIYIIEDSVNVVLCSSFLLTSAQTAIMIIYSFPSSKRPRMQFKFRWHD